MVVKGTSTIFEGKRPSIQWIPSRLQERNIVNPTFSGGKRVLEKQFN